MLSFFLPEAWTRLCHRQKIDCTNAKSDILIAVWHLATSGFHNPKVIWEELIGDQVVAALKKKHKAQENWIFPLGSSRIY